jgi:uncharacterized membrane-anchored protein YhcB (DUF1043 family)
MENKTSKYLKYAIGEIILVVIGILIALSINTWNENKKNVKEAQFQLSKLKDNLNTDKAQLKTVISEDSAYISNLTFCVKVLAGELKATKEAFTDRFQDLLNTNNFNPVRGAFDGLISSGKIELIKNQNLLDALFLYYNNTSFKSWDSAMTDYSRNIIAPYIMNFDHVPNIRPEHENINFTQFDITKFAMPSKTIDDYKNNLFLINALRIKIQLFEGQKIQYIKLQKEIDLLIDQINLELK